MKTSLALAAAGAALAGLQAVASTPASAYDYCSPYRGYYYARPCCSPYAYGPAIVHAPAYHYRPIVRRAVRTVTYYEVVGYRPVRAWRRPCCR